MVIGPGEWGAGFWERFFDGDPESVEEFQRTCRQIDSAERGD